MANNTNYITEKDMKSIYKRINNYFAKGNGKTIEQQLAIYKRRITTIINEIQLEQKTHISKSEKRLGQVVVDGWKIAGVDSNQDKKYKKQKLLAEGYLLIQELRVFLTEETLNYRYYYIDSNGQAKVTEFAESDLLKYIKLTDTKITMAVSTLQEINNNEKYQKYLDLHYENLMRGLRPSDNSPGFWVVTSEIFDQYANKNKGLKQEKVPTRYKLFNYGHIFEAMDKTISKMQQAQEKQNAEDLFFGEFLKYDNVSGFKGGDNPYTNTQIKANQADLMDYITIINTLTEIRDLLTLTDEASRKVKIEKLFFDAERYSSVDDLNKAIDKAFKQLTGNK